MKKLIVLAGAACAAVFAHGAAVDWEVSKNSTDMTKNATVYAFLAADAASVTTALGNTSTVDGFETALGAAGVSYSNGYSKDTGSGKGAAAGSLSDTGIADNSDISMMLVVFDADGKNYTTVSGITGHSYSAETAATASTADFSDAFGSASWTALGGGGTPDPGPSPDPLPEPTSGLLLLVGGAMLALRRKQK